jgi:AcrR family transcriptional regulator
LIDSEVYLTEIHTNMPPITQLRLNKVVRQRRQYKSQSRQRQFAETRERIVIASIEIVHQCPTWDWTNLKSSVVAQGAGVSQRTVERHFTTDRQLREVVLQRLVDESGITLGKLTLNKFDNTVMQLFGYLSSFRAQPVTPLIDDPVFIEMDKVRRDALIDMVARETPDWSVRDRETAAAVLDLLWALPSYERFSVAWGFESEHAINALTWVVGLVKEGIQQGKLPAAVFEVRS